MSQKTEANVADRINIEIPAELMVALDYSTHTNIGIPKKMVIIKALWDGVDVETSEEFRDYVEKAGLDADTVVDCVENHDEKVSKAL